MLNRNYGKFIALVFFLALCLSAAVFSGCAQVAEVASPDAEAVQEADAQMLATVETDRIYGFIFINQIPVGGLTKEEAFRKLQEELYAPLENQKIILRKDDKTWPLALSELDYNYGVEKGVEEAFSVARTGDIQERYEKIRSLEANPYHITLNPAYDKTRISSFLAEIAKEVNTPPTEPMVVRENRELKTSQGAGGMAVNIEVTSAKIEELADRQEGGEVLISLVSVEPKFTLDELLEAHKLIGTYSTPITGSAQRDINLTVASGYVDGVTLYPGEEFSTNATIGPTTYERGYRSAPVIVNGKLEDGIGGGVCQVSSTLYNAVLFAELEIVQRRNHSLVVGYCPIGRDATLAGDVIDFRFKNSTEYPIYIESYLEGKQLFVNIYGDETRPANRTLDFESVHVSSTAAPETREIPDPSLPEGERVVSTPPLIGQVVDVYKKIMVDGQVVDRVYVDRSTYRARAGEVRVGTGPAAPEAPATDAPASPEAPAYEGPVDNSVPPEWIRNSQPSPQTDNQEDSVPEFNDLDYAGEDAAW